MKYFVKFFVVTFFLLICTYTFAEQKIVVLDMKLVLNNSKAGKGAQDFLVKTFKDNQKKFSDLEKKLKEEETIRLKEEKKKRLIELEERKVKAEEARRIQINEAKTSKEIERENLKNIEEKTSDISPEQEKKDLN